MRVTFFARWTFIQLESTCNPCHTCYRPKQQQKKCWIQHCAVLYTSILWVTWIESQAAVDLIRFTLPLITSKTATKMCAPPLAAIAVRIDVLGCIFQSINRAMENFFMGLRADSFSFQLALFFLFDGLLKILNFCTFSTHSLDQPDRIYIWIFYIRNEKLTLLHFNHRIALWFLAIVSIKWGNEVFNTIEI